MTREKTYTRRWKETKEEEDYGAEGGESLSGGELKGIAREDQIEYCTEAKGGKIIKEEDTLSKATESSTSPRNEKTPLGSKSNEPSLQHC